MADSHSTSDFAVSGTERHLIVGYRPQGRDTTTPSLTLSGKWLRAAGFDTGKRFTVKVMDGCIVLTAVEPEPELEAVMRRVEKLSARKQKQVREFIGVIGGRG